MTSVFEGETPKKIFQEFLIALKCVLFAFITSTFRLFKPKPKKCVKNKIVLITGAGSGIGQSLTLEFFKLGAVVILWDSSEHNLQKTRLLIEESRLSSDTARRNSECCQIPGVYDYICDVGNREDVYRVAERVKAEVGTVDILVNNAAIVTGKTLLDLPDDRIIETFNVNLLSHFWTVKCFLPAMVERNSGQIVSLASSCGFVGLRKLLDYSASKFGVLGFSEVLNYETTFAGYDGVRVTTVIPSFIKTGMFQGCQMRFQKLLPDLEVAATVNRMMEGILREEYFIYIPGRIGFVPFCKSLLPYDAWIATLKFLGADTFMDSFRGRSETPT